MKRPREKPRGIVGSRLLALREALHLTQAVVRKEGHLGTTDVAKIEIGENDASTYRIRAGLAHGMGMAIEDLAAYLDGEIDLAEAVKRRTQFRPRAPTTDPCPNRAEAVEIMRRAGVSDEAIADVVAIPVSGELAAMPTLYWIDRVRMQHLKRLAEFRAGPGPTVIERSITPAAGTVRSHREVPIGSTRRPVAAPEEKKHVK